MDEKVKDYLFVKLDKKDARKAAVSSYIFWACTLAIVLLCLLEAAGMTFAMSYLFNYAIILLFAITFVSFLFDFYMVTSLHIPSGCGLEVSGLLLFCLPDDVRMYQECIGIIVGKNCKYIHLHELQELISGGSDMDSKKFRKQIEHMCRRKWFRHGHIVGDVLCVTDSAKDYINGLAEQGREEYLKQEQGLVAKNTIPEMFGSKN